METISGKILRDAIISGANNIGNHKTMIDELNVFPVPDGDTGTNMFMTIKGAIAQLSLLPDDTSVSTVADVAADAMLRSARGNSGVILSLLFRGLTKGLSGKHSASVKDYAEGLKAGVHAAYSSVMKPTEGTMLTVARIGAEAVDGYADSSSDFKGAFAILIESSEEAVDNTPNLLPVLKKAGVVDAGGMGYLVILKGMCEVINGEPPIKAVSGTGVLAIESGFEKAISEFDTNITFTYCTEYIVIKSADAKDSKLLRAYLETIGDSVAVVEGGDIIKVHVHTENPGKALEEGLLFGSLSNMKIENMKEQNKSIKTKTTGKRTRLPFCPPEDEYGFVAVANGAGIEALFSDFGVNYIVRGGQTNNPPADDLLEAILATPARNVFVLPNNKNIIMTAEQALKLVNDRNVTVLQTKTIPQGICAMMSFDPDLSVSENATAMTDAIERVSTGLVTYAARDSDFEGKSIKKGDILGLENGKLATVGKDVFRTLVKIIRKLTKSSTQFITIIYGADVSDETAQRALERIESKVISNNINISLINGGQPLYYYIVSVED